MGTSFEIEVVASDPRRGREAIAAAFAEVERTEEVLSQWSESSELSHLNRSSGAVPVTVSPELMVVLERALYFSSVTAGAFDITFAACEGVWSVGRRRIPTDAEIAACLCLVDFRRVALDPQRSTVLLAPHGTRIGLDGLAKGYRVDRAAAALEQRGIADYVVNGGGDIRLSSSDPTRPHRIEVAHPRLLGALLGTLSLTSGSVATSGDYQRYFERDGVRFHHILDPATGRPARRAVAATVLAPTAMDADALATGLFVMGPEAGIAAAERLPGVEALIVAPDLSIHTSSGFPALRPALLDTP